jgi:hypothetical protein
MWHAERVVGFHIAQRAPDPGFTENQFNGGVRSKSAGRNPRKARSV